MRERVSVPSGTGSYGLPTGKSLVAVQQPWKMPDKVTVPDNKSRNIPEVIIVRRGAGGVLGIWEGWVNWVKGGANGVSLQAT